MSGMSLIEWKSLADIVSPAYDVYDYTLSYKTFLESNKDKEMLKYIKGKINKLSRDVEYNYEINSYGLNELGITKDDLEDFLKNVKEFVNDAEHANDLKSFYKATVEESVNRFTRHLNDVARKKLCEVV